MPAPPPEVVDWSAAPYGAGTTKPPGVTTRGRGVACSGGATGALWGVVAMPGVGAIGRLPPACGGAAPGTPGSPSLRGAPASSASTEPVPASRAAPAPALGLAAEVGPALDGGGFGCGRGPAANAI